MRSSYSIQLVILSYIVAALASHVTLSLAQRLRPMDGTRDAHRPLYWPWIVGGAFSMGTGIWSMHFIGMLAFHLPIQVAYDLPLTATSWLIAVIVSGFALHRFHLNDTTVRGIAVPGVFIGIGISAMHYTGMAAMRMSPDIDYDPLLFLASVLIAIVASMTALGIAFSLPDGQRGKRWHKIAAASVMGAAIVGMHYTGMAAAHFAPNAVCISSGPRLDATWLAISISMFTFLILGSTLLLSVIDAQLQSTIARSAESLRIANEDLEQRVLDRTAQLQTVNHTLQAEIAARQHTEQRLRDSYERTLAIFETALDGIITIDQEGRITEFNPAAEQIFGFRRAAVLGQLLADVIIPPNARAAHRRGLTHYLATAESSMLGKRIELEGLRADGSYVTVELSINRMPGAGPIFFTGFVRDITERTRAETALRESQQLLQAIIDNSQAVVYVKDLAGRYLLVNRRFEEIFRLGRESILGRTDHHLFAKEAADAFRDLDVRVARADHALTAEETAPQADGLHTYISIKAPLRDAAGKANGVFGISTDITDRKRHEERLRTQLARLSLLDETTRAIGQRQDLRSLFQVVIRNLEEHLPVDFGCACLYDPAQQALSVTCVGVKSQALALELALPEEARIAVDENGLGRCVRGQLVYESGIGESSFPFAARLGRVGLRSLVFAPLVVESDVFGIMIAARRGKEGFTSDDCEFLRQLSGHVALAAHQSQLYGALQRAYEDLRQTQQTVMQQERLRALGQMASGIAHDINNALSPAALYVQSLLERDRSLSSEARNYLIITLRAIEDVANTIARMREFYRMREPQLALLPVNVNRVLQQVMDLTHARWSDMPLERGILIRVQTEFAAHLPTILGAENEIRDALTNLILNAVDAMPEGGTLTLRSNSLGATSAPGTDAPTAARVSVEVRDTGIGMSEAVRNRCLEPFFTTKGERGTGLGLAMVYGMTQRHSAELEIDSELGAGTTVRLIFPVAATSAAAVSAADVRLLKRLRILIVDDDPLLLQSLQDSLERDGHLIGVADGGQAGIDEFCAAQQRGTPFDAVVTDLGMPHIDGRTVATAIKSRAPATPVILLTGWGYRMQEESDAPQHVDRVLSKPPNLYELRAALSKLVGGRTSASESQEFV
jgi:PAS domain S-box-containing protein